MGRHEESKLSNLPARYKQEVEKEVCCGQQGKWQKVMSKIQKQERLEMNITKQ